MAPPRYNQQSMNGPFSHVPQNHLQSHNPSQHHGILPAPHLAAPAAFGPGTSTSTSPFAMSGNTTNGFDRGLSDGSLLHNQPSSLGYARGGPVQAHQNYDSAPNLRENKEDPRIRNVWKQNLKQEMATLRSLVDRYPYIAMDTEFPGIVARPIGSFTTKADYHYQTLRCNVDLLKMIQLGITLFKPDGSVPSSETDLQNKPSYLPSLTPACTWQFNFRFSLSDDMYASESTTMLSKAGLDFARHESHGIEPEEFGALLISSGLVLEPDVKWISFHSGYDFGYLMKIMINKELPDDEMRFHSLLEKFFPSLFDIKYIVKHIGTRQSVNNNQTLTPEASVIIQNINQKSGLQDLANELGIQRIGVQHQAGSDSLLTGQVYFKMCEKIFNGTIDEERYSGQVWGLNGQMPTGMTSSSNNRDFNTPNMNGATFYMGSNGAPSTPQTGNIGLAGQQTPAPSQSTHGPGSSFGNLTPGGFGSFQYPKAMG